MRDLTYALRSLLRTPGFAAVAVLTLALGVGANTAVFSLINSVLLRPLPYEEPDRLVLVWESAPFFNTRDSPVAPANYFDWKARSRSFEEIGAMEDQGFRLIGEGTPEVVFGSYVSASFLRALRTRPAIGRVFRDDEDQPGAAKVVILTDAFWRRRFGADPNVIGRTVTLNDAKHTVVGVLAPGTEPPAEYHGTPGEILIPFGSAYTQAGLSARGRHNWMVAARLKPGVKMEQANSEMAAIGEALKREYPDTNEKVGAFVAPMREHFVGSTRRLFFILLGTVGFVLLIACSNLANLLLSRAANRSKEVGVRLALGAGVWPLMRQFLCESLLVCAAGSALGLLLATSTFRSLAHLAPGAVMGFKTLGVDWRVLAFTLAVALATAVVFSLIPLIQVRRLDVNRALKQSSRSLAAAAGSRRMRAALIATEVGLAFMLLIGAGLLIQTFARLRGVDVGFRTHNLLTLVMPPSEKYRGPEKSANFQREVLRRVTAVPGVESAGFTNHIPFVDKGDISGILAEGREENDRVQCRSRMAGPGYLRTMGIPLLKGRDIDERDAAGAPYAVLVNQTLARALWPNQDPIGRRIVFEAKMRVPVTGVVGDIRQGNLDEAPPPAFYVSTLQTGYGPALAVRTKVDPASVAGVVRRAIWSLDPDQPIAGVSTMEEILDREVFQRRLQMTLLGVFAGLALVLAAVGLYGVLSYLVGRQVPEIGIRMALGAAPRAILRRVVGQGLALTGVGICFGIAGALAASRLVATVLFGVKPTDPATYAAVAAVLLATAAAASYIPARRAMRVDPIAALREE